MTAIDLSNIDNLPAEAFFFTGGTFALGDRKPARHKANIMSDQGAFSMVADMKRQVEQIKRVDEELRDREFSLVDSMREMVDVRE